MRLFVALPLPETVRLSLAALGGGIPGARWVPDVNMHLTLRFIGEVDSGQAADIAAALSGVRAPAFQFSLVGVGQFGDGWKTRVIYAAVERCPELSDLQSRVESAVARCGLPPEGRKFKPHVTLARLRNAPPDRVGAFRARHSLLRTDPIEADRFVLYSSRLGRQGPYYEEEAEFPLSLSPAAARPYDAALFDHDAWVNEGVIDPTLVEEPFPDDLTDPLGGD